MHQKEGGGGKDHYSGVTSACRSGTGGGGFSECPVWGRPAPAELLLRPNKRVVGVVSGHPGGRLLATTGNLPRFLFFLQGLVSSVCCTRQQPIFLLPRQSYLM